MDPFRALSRRSFVRLGVSTAALTPLAGLVAQAHAAAPDSSGGDPWKGLKVGIASYTFSRLPLEATIEAIRGIGVNYVSIKDAHLPLKTTAAQRKAVVQQFRDAGITPLSCGNITMTDDPANIRNAFEYARDAGIPVIVCKPTKASLPVLDKMVKEFDIKIAIHNHGPEDNVWPSPYVAWDAIQPYDERVGLCIDVGHTARTGRRPHRVDPQVRRPAPRRPPQGHRQQGREVQAGRGRPRRARHPGHAPGAHRHRLHPARRPRVREGHEEPDPRGDREHRL